MAVVGQQKLQETHKTQPVKRQAKLPAGYRISRRSPLIGGQYGQDIEHSADYRYNENTNSWDEIYTVGDVSLVYSVAENKLTIEYDGRTDEVAWAIQHFGGGVGMSIGLVDMTWDGSEELMTGSLDCTLCMI